MKASKKGKKNKSLIPSRDVPEGFDVLRFIFADIKENQYLKKQFLADYSEKMDIYKREFPLYKEEMGEKLLYSSCIELIVQLLNESPPLLIARNELILYRQILGHIFGLFGIIYECCLITLDELIPGRYHTFPVEYFELMEKISLLVFPKILGGYPKNDYLNLGHLPQPEPVHQGKSKAKKKPSKKKEVSLTLQDPLYAFDIIQMINIAFSDLNSNMKSYALDAYFESLQKWIRDLMNKRVNCPIDKSWDVCSKLASPDNIYPITSEDRHILCGYQVISLSLVNNSP